MKLKPMKKLLALSLMSSLFMPVISQSAVYNNGTKTANFDVTLTINADCSISAAALNFGSAQGVLASAINVNTTLSVTCTNNTLYNIGLNAGTGTSSVGTTRYMAGTGSNTDKVQFNLYQLAGSTLWGDTQGTDTKSGSGNGNAQTLTVYGQIPAQSTPQPDSYKSTITATVYF